MPKRRWLLWVSSPHLIFTNSDSYLYNHIQKKGGNIASDFNASLNNFSARGFAALAAAILIVYTESSKQIGWKLRRWIRRIAEYFISFPKRIYGLYWMHWIHGIYWMTMGSSREELTSCRRYNIHRAMFLQITSQDHQELVSKWDLPRHITRDENFRHAVARVCFTGNSYSEHTTVFIGLRRCL